MIGVLIPTWNDTKKCKGVGHDVCPAPFLQPACERYGFEGKSTLDWLYVIHFGTADVLMTPLKKCVAWQ